jgi:hypothetical protein
MVSKRRRAEGRLSAFLENHDPAAGLLPLVHITRAYAFDEMLVEGLLKPTDCEIFKEPLIYLFYGKPAYRAKNGNNARLEFEWPIVFVFHPDKVGTIKRVFPFDTGAFERRIYSEFFDSNSKIVDFELEPSLASAQKVVGAFYRNHKEYYDGASRKNVEIGIRQFEAQGIHELSRVPGTKEVGANAKVRDERSSSIEIQLSDPIDFTENLLAVVIPEPYLDDDEVKQALARWRVKEIETYPTLHNTSGEAWVGEIYMVIRRLYERLGFFK